MKKCYFFAVAMLLFAACSKDDGESGMPALPNPNDVCSAMDDLKFMEYCYKNFDINGNGEVSKEEAAAVREIDLRYEEVKSLKGIAYFPNLEELYCYENELTSLDVSNNTALKHLKCACNKLTSLNISKNTALKHLVCDENELTSLDISKNTALKEFVCYGNPGDGTTFSVKAWFDNNNIPEGFEDEGWWRYYDNGNEKYIQISYHK